MLEHMKMQVRPLLQKMNWKLLSVVLADTEDVWHEVFAVYGERYREPTLTLYSGSVSRGVVLLALTWDHCPADENIYMIKFYYELRISLMPLVILLLLMFWHMKLVTMQKLMGTTDYVFAKQDQLSKNLSIFDSS